MTHPFHPLFGQCLVVLFTKRRGGAPVVVCAGGVGDRVTVTLPVGTPSATMAALKFAWSAAVLVPS